MAAQEHTDQYKVQYQRKELELNALLEITQAINNNVPEEALYRIYHFTLRANLSISKMALFVKDKDWSCKAHFGTTLNYTELPLPTHFVESSTVRPIKVAEGPFSEFDYIIPVAHKRNMLAVVLVGGGEPLAAQDKAEAPEIDFIQALSNIILVAIENKKLARKQLQQQLAQEAFNKEMEIARNVQQLLFPNTLTQMPGIRVHASYIPHHQVGGDYYDYLTLDDNQFLFCIADVSGKGIPAAILMSNFQASLRTLARKTTDLKEIVAELNYQIFASANGENFITFFVALYNSQTKTLRYINAGHNPPVLIDNKRQWYLLEDGTTIIGAFNELPFINEGKIANMEGFLFFSYTDGLTETFNQQDEAYGTDRLIDYLMGQIEQPLEFLHKGLFAELESFKGQTAYQDDITILSCRVT